MVVCSLVIASATFTSCSDDNTELRTDDTNVPTITVTPTNTVKERSITINAAPNTLQKVRVVFKEGEKMRRLYLTKYEIGVDEGPVSYKYPTAKTNNDNSIDIDGDDKNLLDFSFNLDTPSKKEGIIQYVLWTTTGRGDFRDVSKRNSIAPNAVGIITIKAGNVFNNFKNTYKSFEKTLLNAPTADDNSQTFMSLFDGKKYAINKADEYVNLWDFGYYWLKSTGATLASASTYRTDIVDLAVKAGVSKADLNKCYFKLSSKSASDFDKINSKEDLDFIDPSSIKSETIQKLNAGDIIEVVDQYGNKGLIKVDKIEPGLESNDYIKILIKVQVKSIPLKG